VSCLAALARPSASLAANGSADLWQARNGSAASPNNPIDWVKGNLGTANSHYVEGQSIPYRLVLTRLTPGHHNVVIEWETRQSGRNTIDFITHYDILLPHVNFVSHSSAEMIDPIAGLTGPFGPPAVVPIPAPSTAGTPVPGQPVASFEALRAERRMMTIWNGSISSLAYLQEGTLAADAATTRLSIDFDATNATVVIAWGGHIASRLDWGAGSSASSISGSPYHTRLVSFDGGGGNQDRSVSIESIFSSINGPAKLCANEVGTYFATTDATNNGAVISWTLANNTADAAILGPTNAPSVQVKSTVGGTFDLKLRLVLGPLMANCLSNVAVIPPPTIECPPDFIASEAPRRSGAASVTFPPPVVINPCDPNAQIACVPPSGATFAVGTTTVTCTLDDRFGNHAECAFTVRVVPFILKATSLADSGPGTLRQALLDANAAPDDNEIHFEFPGQPPYSIHLLSPLPPLSDTVMLDGTSQPGFLLSPVVELDGAGPAQGFVPAALTAGLVLASPGNVVRGLVLNGFDVGIRVDSASGNVIEGNYIGPDMTGTNPIGNHIDGIVLQGPGASGNLIRSNLIAFNGGNGITLAPDAGTGNAFRANSIFDNGGLGIDLGADGPTPNDSTDADSGPNGLQNFPSIAQAASDGLTTTTIRALMDGPPGAVTTVEFFLNDAADTSGFGEGRIFLGATKATNDVSGQGDVTITFQRASKPGQFATTTAIAAAGNASEFSRAVLVEVTPFILLHPITTNAAPGGMVQLCVTADGSAPLRYQWRHNGANIPGATDACYFVPAADVPDGGSYTVVVVNDFGAAISAPAPLLLELRALQAGDDYADRTLLVRTNGLVSGSNTLATFEVGEPLHAGKTGGKSVWYVWTAPANGVATFRTVGSTFDTLLGIYTGTSISNLVAVASDEDSGGFYASGARFNTLAGVTYHIAIDGFGGASGQFIFSWELALTNAYLPVITNQPSSQTVAPGGTAVFRVAARFGCRDGHHDCRHEDRDPPGQGHPDEDGVLTYQWFLNKQAILGATNKVLTISNVSEAVLGSYTARVADGPVQVDSLAASLQINLTGQFVEPVQAMDKFLDAVLAPAQLHLGNSGGAFVAGDGGFQPASIARGYTGTQVFNTSGSITEGGEEPICGVLGGASEWITMVCEESGRLYVNTDGSSYDTVMAIFRRNPTNSALLQELACDNNGGVDRRDSATNLLVQANQTIFIVVDGVNGASGTLRLNYSLVTSGLLRSMGFTPQRAHVLQLNTHAGARFSIQCSSNLTSWTTILTTNTPISLFEFIDSASIRESRRYYRALMLP
jgi:hypothetical protein